MSDAIQHAHQAGVIHRDLKPSNVMLDLAGEPYIMDFGLAKRQVGEITMTMAGKVLGTPAYMSPEQAKGDAHSADARSDIYSLGVILFELLTGHKPFRGNLRMLLHQVIHEDAPSPRRLDSRISRDLETICLKCLEKDPRRRYGTAQDLGNELRRFMRSEPIQARRITPVDRAWRWCKRKPAISGLAAALFVALLGGFAGVTRQWLRADAEMQRANEIADLEIQARQRADAAHALAEANAERNRQLLYISDMSTALQAWESANVGRVIELLRRHEPRPQQTDLRGFEWYYLWGLCRQSANTPGLDHQGPVFSVAFSPDGTTLASGGFRTLKIWNVATGEELHSRIAHENYIGGLAFSPDGKRLATGSHDRTVKLWDPDTGELDTMFQFDGAVTRLAFSPDGATLASNGGRGIVTLSNISDGTKRTLSGHSMPVMSVAFSHGGTVLASGDSRGTIKVWDLEHDEQEPTTIEAHQGWVWSLAFSPDDATLASGSRDYSVKLWDLINGTEKAALAGHDNFVASVGFSPDGKLLASSSWDGTVKLWDPETGGLRATLKGHSHWINTIAFSSDRRTLASGSVDQKIMLWDLSLVPNREMPRGLGASLSSNAEKMVTWIRDGTFTIYDVTSGGSRAPGRIAVCAAISPDGRRLAAGADGDVVKVWDLEKREVLASLSGHAPQKFVIFSPDGKTLATARNTTLRLWDTDTFTERASIEVSRPSLPVFQYPVAFSADGRTIATAIQSETERRWALKLWRMSDGRELLKLPGHTTPVGSLAFSPDGKTLASASHGGSLQLWDIDSGQAKGEALKGHVGGVYAVAFSPDGSRLVSGASDGSVRIWDLASRDEIMSLNSGTGRVFSLAFSADGQTLVTANEDETVRLWHAHRR